MTTANTATHINIYSKSPDPLGRWLSNFAHTPLDLGADGWFESVEGYWYWLSTGMTVDALRTLHGFDAKSEGKKHPRGERPADFRDRIKNAIRVKVSTGGDMAKAFADSTLPLEHYYVFNGVKKEAGHGWLVVFLEELRKELKGGGKATHQTSAGDLPPASYKILGTVAKLKKFFRRVERTRLFSFDYETNDTTWQDAGTIATLLALAADTDQTYVVKYPRFEGSPMIPENTDRPERAPSDHPLHATTRHMAQSTKFGRVLHRGIVKILLDPTIEKVNHNIKFDIHILSKYIEVPALIPNLWDTMYMYKLIDENSRNADLKSLSEKYLHATAWGVEFKDYMKANGYTWGTVPFEALAAYADLDPKNSIKLARIFRKIMAEIGVLRRYELIDMWMVSALRVMDAEGMGWCQVTADAAQRRLAELIDARYEAMVTDPVVAAYIERRREESVTDIRASASMKSLGATALNKAKYQGRAALIEATEGRVPIYEHYCDGRADVERVVTCGGMLLDGAARGLVMGEIEKARRGEKVLKGTEYETGVKIVERRRKYIEKGVESIRAAGGDGDDKGVNKLSLRLANYVRCQRLEHHTDGAPRRCTCGLVMASKLVNWEPYVFKESRDRDPVDILYGVYNLPLKNEWVKEHVNEDGTLGAYVDKKSKAGDHIKNHITEEDGVTVRPFIMNFLAITSLKKRASGDIGQPRAKDWDESTNYERGYFANVDGTRWRATSHNKGQHPTSGVGWVKAGDKKPTGTASKTYAHGNALGVYPTFKGHSVVTGRLACVQPNVMNVSSRDKLNLPDTTEAIQFSQKVYTVEDGFVDVEVDYSQMELRLAAMYSQDPEMLRIYASGGDIHAESAAMMVGKTMAEFKALPKDEYSLMRFRAKAVNFGFIYNATAKTFQAYARDNYGWFMTIEEAKVIRKKFFTKYAGLASYYKRVDDHLRVTRKLTGTPTVTTLCGRLRRLPNIFDVMKDDDGLPLIGFGGKLRKTGVAREQVNQSVNHPIQGSAADLMNTGYIKLNRELPQKWGGVVRIKRQVHDSLLFRVPADPALIVEVMAYIKEVMEGVTSHPTVLELMAGVKDLKWGGWSTGAIPARDGLRIKPIFPMSDATAVPMSVDYKLTDTHLGDSKDFDILTKVGEASELVLVGRQRGGKESKKWEMWSAGAAARGDIDGRVVRVVGSGEE